MVSKISLIFLITFTVVISFGNGVSFTLAKIQSPKTHVKKIPKNVKEFVDLVTLNETLTFWNQSNFHFCFNRDSYPYNLALLEFVQGLKDSLEKFMSLTNKENRNFVLKNYEDVIQTYVLMEQGRNSIYLETQGFDSVEEKLKKKLDFIKKELKENFARINNNFPKIQNGANTELQHKKLAEIEKKYKTKLENVRQESINFVASIKQCMGISKK